MNRGNRIRMTLSHRPVNLKSFAVLSKVFNQHNFVELRSCHAPLLFFWAQMFPSVFPLSVFLLLSVPEARLTAEPSRRRGSLVFDWQTSDERTERGWRVEVRVQSPMVRGRAELGKLKGGGLLTRLGDWWGCMWGKEMKNHTANSYWT